MRKLTLLLFVLCITGYRTNAQTTDYKQNRSPLDYSNYISQVGKGNIAYAAERFNLNITETEAQSAAVFPDPELNFNWSDNGQRRMDMGYGFGSELSWTWELGGKRKARINLAKNQVQLTRLLLANYFHNLRSDATLSFLASIQNKLLLQVQEEAYQSVKQLATSDSIRHKLGSISAIDARQSQLEALRMRNEVYAAEAEWQNALSDLSLWMGTSASTELLDPQGKLTNFDRQFSVQELITTALNNRADMQAALQNKEVAQSMIKLAKADRAIDLGLSIGMGYASYVRNVIAPTPSTATVNAGISIPLKFSNRRSGDLRGAQYGALQAEQEYKQTELEIQTEVKQRYQHYMATQKQVRQYEKGLLIEAKAILDGKIYSYQRGETSLLEVLDAQRTHNETQQGYYQTLYNYASSLVELERAAGIWDINF